jgi:hypothetical protein
VLPGHATGDLFASVIAVKIYHGREPIVRVLVHPELALPFRLQEILYGRGRLTRTDMIGIGANIDDKLAALRYHPDEMIQ